MYKVKNTSEMGTYFFSVLLAAGFKFSLHQINDAYKNDNPSDYHNLYFSITSGFITIIFFNECLKLLDASFISCYSRGCCITSNDSSQLTQQLLSADDIAVETPTQFFEPPSLSTTLKSYRRKSANPISVILTTCLEMLVLPRCINKPIIQHLILAIAPVVLYLFLNKVLDAAEYCYQHDRLSTLEKGGKR